MRRITSGRWSSYLQLWLLVICIQNITTSSAGKRSLYRFTDASDVEVLARELEFKSADIWKVNRHKREIDFIANPDVARSSLEQNGGELRVLVEDMDALIREERAGIHSYRSKRSTSPELDFTKFPSFEELEDYLHHIAEKHSQFVKLESHGYTHENRSLYLLKIGQINSRIEKKAMFLDAGIHAREWASVSSMAFIVSRLVDLFSDPQKMLNDVRSQVNYYIMPLANPDGYEYTRSTDRLWRKNRAPPPENSTCYGVDLNRNWNVSGYGVGASDDPCSQIYKGSEPDSEPEVITAKKLISSFSDIRHYLGFHSYGSYVLTPFGYTKKLPEDNIRLLKVGHAMREAIYAVNSRNYSVGSPAHIFYVAGGASDDYSKLSGIPTSMTIELPEVDGTGFILPSESIIDIGKEAWASLEPAAAQIVEYEDYEVQNSIYVGKN
uniref:Carboxypeptidase B n=1 Tax=Caligus clemensi TaxID=344056 RepID=C1C214_CALCM|nr:Carboxypeptidase B [Caligus clemensi]